MIVSPEQCISSNVIEFATKKKKKKKNILQKMNFEWIVCFNETFHMNFCFHKFFVPINVQAFDDGTSSVWIQDDDLQVTVFFFIFLNSLEGRCQRKIVFFFISYFEHRSARWQTSFSRSTGGEQCKSTGKMAFVCVRRMIMIWTISFTSNYQH